MVGRAKDRPHSSSVQESVPDSAGMAEADQGVSIPDIEDQVLGNQRPAPFKQWRRRSVKFIVVGDSGLGKSTLIKALLSTPQERLQACSGDHDRFLRNPSALCTTVSWRDEVDRIVWTYTIQDTPGFGHLEDPDTAIKAVVDFIERQNEKRLQLEQSFIRAVDLEELDDPRIALCLYCVGPHRLRPIDLKYMYMIGLQVPVVPIVTKADTMTVREADIHRNLVIDKLANPMVPGVHGKINVFNFSRDACERAGVMGSWEARPPFLVIASDDLNENRISSDVSPTYWPERSYPWGVAQAFNPFHSDLLTLRSLLFKEALEDIVRSKRQHYEGWRRKRLQGKWIKRKLWHLLGWVLLPAAAYRVGQSITGTQRHSSVKAK